jgi:hypothetical protein
MAVKLVPLFDQKAVMLPPDRTSRTQYGATIAPVLLGVTLVPLVVRRCWKRKPLALSGVTSA